MKHLKLYENFTPHYPSDALRTDTVEAFLNNITDEEFLEEHSDDPEMDLLLDPYDGYEWQTYIQYKNNQIIYWEGWSKYCWDSLYQKKEYQGLSKEKCIDKTLKERFIPSMEHLGLKYIGSDYWYEESWTDGVDDGYIMKVIFELK